MCTVEIECVCLSDPGEATLGRGSECEVVIAARSLSRKHATILVEGGTHFVRDLDSRNKTYRRAVSCFLIQLILHESTV